ncbi:hypothetical protein [Methanococcoides sp.]|jgi:hypothetical protein|uniref:hypothetical protein n=1 Tax=Methanococcoides sp. TaxID=1966350 RepID=UPI00272E92FF|nr:hypothetical protein [Methanococcoides sp.]
MAGTFFLVSMALFANSGWIYFPTVFIIATLVTDSLFLQNLAAIIKGTDSYFENQEPRDVEEKKLEMEKDLEDLLQAEKKVKEESVKEVVKKVVNETDKNVVEEAIHKLTEENVQEVVRNTAQEELYLKKADIVLDNEQKKKKLIHSYFSIEDSVFTYLERMYGSTIIRNQRIINQKKQSVELDGLLKFGFGDLIFEIKLVPISIPIENILDKYIAQCKNILDKYKSITGRSAKLKLVIVGDSLSQFKNIEDDNIDRFNIIIHFLSFEEIGLKILDDGSFTTIK